MSMSQKLVIVKTFIIPKPVGGFCHVDCPLRYLELDLTTEKVKCREGLSEGEVGSCEDMIPSKKCPAYDYL